MNDNAVSAKNVQVMHCNNINSSSQDLYTMTFSQLFQKTFLFQAQYAKSLPSLSSYLSSKGRSAIIQLEPKLEHGNSEQNGNDSWRKSRQCSTENIVSNGAKSNAFKSATQKYSMLPNNNKVCSSVVEFRYFSQKYY